MSDATQPTPAASPPYRIVVLDGNDNPVRTLYRSQHYAAVLGFLSRNLAERPNLDVMKGDKHVAWELIPAIVPDTIESIA